MDETDAKFLHHLETCVASTTEDRTTAYLTEIQLFQKQQTTSAFKLAGGVDLTARSARHGKQYTIASEFNTKIAKAFLDSLYAILDGLFQLSTSPDLDAILNARVIIGAGDVASATTVGSNLLEMLDMSDTVSCTSACRYLRA
jgi:exocyst complex component 2